MYRLSGESPFQGDSDSETLASVTAAQWEFDEESFEDITNQAKDFISSLLQKNVRLDIRASGHTLTHSHTHTWKHTVLSSHRQRMSCDEALSHAWMATSESADPGAAKNLSKDKMKKFLARQKWKVLRIHTGNQKKSLSGLTKLLRYRETHRHWRLLP